MSKVRFRILAQLLVCLLCTPAARGVEPGVVLGTESWQQARGLLPAEFLEAYRRGDLRHEVRDFDVEEIGDDPIFQAALERNRGRYALPPDGTVIERSSGNVPNYVYGWPFPDIDPNDPQAAVKIVWNYSVSTGSGADDAHLSSRTCSGWRGEKPARRSTWVRHEWPVTRILDGLRSLIG